MRRIMRRAASWQVRWRRGSLLALACAVAPTAACAMRDATPAHAVQRDAQAVLSRCGARATQDCVAQPLLQVVDSSGPAHSMAVLEEMLRRQPRLGADAHGLAHAIGIRAYDSPATLSQVFASCPPTHLSGCYHGVMQAYFLGLRESTAPASKSLLDSLCADHRAVSDALYFQCVHGVGHGLMALHDNYLPAALASCDLLSAPSDVESCHAGSFMENLIVATHPHHSALAHASDLRGGPRAPGAQDAGEHGQHTAHETRGAKSSWTALDPKDEQYPCSVLEPRYQSGCYNMQSSVMLFHNRGHVARTAAACERAPEAFLIPCLRSLGRDVFALAGGDYAKGAGKCGELEGPRELHCVYGFAQTVVNVRASAEDGMRFCDEVTGGQEKGACYFAVAGMMQAFAMPPAERARLCGGLAEAYRLDCAAVAGIPPVESQR